MLDTHQILVKAIIERDDAALLMRRSKKDAPDPYQNLTGAWDIPGGRLRIGEGIEKGLEREVAEETGLRINQINGILEVKTVLSWESNCIIRITYICSVYDGQVILSEEHTAAQWFQKQELARLYYKDKILRETVIKYLRGDEQ